VHSSMMVQSSLLTLTLNICVGIAAAQSVVSIGFPAVSHLTTPPKHSKTDN
jgi:hypothetical protein